MKMCIIKEPMFKNWSMASYSVVEQTFLQVLTSYGESDNATEKMIYEYIAYGKEASPADIQVSSVKR